MIYLVSLYYPPVTNPPGKRIGQLARVLVEKYGAENVRVVTGRPNYPEGKIAPEYKWRLFKKRQGDCGEIIHHIYEIPAPFRGRNLKTLGLLSFGISVLIYFLLRRISKRDIVFVTSGPVFPAYSVHFVSLLKRRLRYVVDVRDLWPQIVAGMGYMKADSVAYRTLMKLSDRTYRRAERSVGNVEGIRDYLVSVTRPDKVHLVYNPVDTELFQPGSSEETGRFRSDHPEIFGNGMKTFLFAGNHSVYMDLITLMRAVRNLATDRNDFVCVLIGYGEEKPGLQEYVQEHGLEKRVVFLPHMEREELVRYICAVDFCYSSTIAAEIYKMVVPTKMAEFMACNKFVVAAHDCPFADSVAAGGNALVARPEDVDDVTRCLRQVLDSPETYLSGVDARRLIEDEFSLEHFDRRMREVFERLDPPLG